MNQNRWMEPENINTDDLQTARLFRFRKTLHLHEIPDSYAVRISADTRYRLYVNGSFVQYGPSKGDHHVWFYDEVNLSPYLLQGDNTIAVLVLHYPEDIFKGNHSMFRFDRPRLYISGIVTDGWKCMADRNTFFNAEEEGFAPLHIHETAVSEDETWKQNGFDDSGWMNVKLSSEASLPEVLKPENLKARTIPFMRRIPHETDIHKEIAANQEYTFVFDAKEEMSAFLRLELKGGAGSEIEMLYSECYEYKDGKGDRTDSINGELKGYTDHITAGDEETTAFEPFWFRTFRYIRFTIHAKAPLTLMKFSYEETGYPLEVKTSVTANDRSLDDIYEISLRTLKRCMQETYIDCPFYEQLQYVMDTRAQILYTYSVSADDRLARKAIDDFARAQRPEGLLNCSYPNNNVNVIPGFSLYYIFIVHDHMMYFGDRKLVRKYLPVIHRILTFFHAHINEDGLLERTGGVLGKNAFWSFIDWAKEWMDTSGMPKAGLYGPVTIESELYVSALLKTAELCDFVNEQGSQTYREEAMRIRESIRSLSMKDGMIKDGPECDDVSQQAQVFGILSGILTKEEGRNALLRTITDPSVTKCTVATAYYLFRALEETDLYEYTDGYWDIWRTMLKNHCTTCVEGENYPRSECHAWGALALYEMPSAILGVRPAAPGYEKILVSPNPGYLTSAQGTVHTPHGDLRVSWKRTDSDLNLTVDCEESLKSRIILK